MFLALLGDDHHTVYIDTTGRVVLEIPEPWGQCNSVSDGLIKVLTDTAYLFLRPVKEGLCKPFLIFKDKNRYTLSNFINGFAIVNDSKLHRDAFINKRGEFIVAPSYYLFSDFSEGMANIYNKEGKYGFIDTLGNIKIPCKYDKVLEPFKSNLAMVVLDKKIIWIDKDGKTIKPKGITKYGE